MRATWWVFNLGVVLVLALAFQARAVETVWTYKAASGYIPGSPGIGDLDGDGTREILVTTTKGTVAALGGDGKELWRHETNALITIGPTVADITGDGRPEVLALTEPGTVYCLSGVTGKVIWRESLPGATRWGRTSIAVGDLDNDGTPEIVTGDELGSVACLDAAGSVVWTYCGPQGHSLCPALADLDGDGLLEVVVGGEERPLVCLSHRGEERWVVDQAVRGASPVVWDLDGDGVPEIIGAIDKQLAVFDTDGNTLWTADMKAVLDAAITVADADGDGTVEIYAVDTSGYLACLLPKGALRWSGDVVERARRSPSVADVDGDGVMDILVAGYSGAIHRFSPEGKLLERIALGGKSNATATIVELAGDGVPCVICPTESSAMPAYRWPGAKAGTQAPWPEYRFNAHRSAAQSAESALAQVRVRIVEMACGDLYAGYNTFHVRVENPEKRNLSVSLVVSQNDGTPSRRTETSSEEAIELDSHYALQGGQTVNLTLACTVEEGDATLAEQTRTFLVEPFGKAMADLSNRLASLEQLVAALPEASGMEERVCFLGAKLPACRERVARSCTMEPHDRRTLRDDLAGLLEESAQMEGVLEGAVALTQSGAGSLAVSAANPWAPFGGIEEIAEGRAESAELSVEAFKGEVESAALNVFNLSGRHRTLRITVSDLKHAGGEPAVPAKGIVTLREAVEVGTQLSDLSADVLPVLNEGSLVVAGAWSGRQVWFTVETEGLAPGEWTATVLLSTLDVEPVEVSVPLSVTVWEAALPKTQALRNCQWGYVHSSRLKDQPEAALADQVAHGTNVFVGLFPPKATYDEQGELVGAIDFTAHDDYVKRHAPHGIILFCGYQGGLKGPGGHESPAYKKAHVAWLRAWVKHMAALGVGYEGYALYPVDEPGLAEGLVERNIFFGELAREADPKIQLYTDPVVGITMEELERLAPYVDIWCPNRHMYVFANEKERAEHGAKFPYIKSTGSTVWTYECEDNAKHKSPLGYYRGQAWLAWRHGMTGIGFWSYCTSSDDPWFKPKVRLDYLLAYQGNGIVTSKRYEAVRDGVEDYSMLNALREATDAAEVAGLYADVVSEANRLLGAEASAIAQYCDVRLPEEGPSQVRGPVLRPQADERWATIQDTRRSIARLLKTFATK